MFRSRPEVPPIVKIELHDEVLNVALIAILSAELFINFAEVETKIMRPNTQIWDDRMVTAHGTRILYLPAPSNRRAKIENQL